MKLTNTKIALLIENTYEDLEFWYPYYRLKEEGAQITVLGTGKASYQGKKGIPAHEDTEISQVSADGFDAVVIPGGYAPDRMRRHRPMIDFVAAAYENDTLIAFICHAGWLPISAGILEGHQVTSFHSIRDDMENAGAQWSDEEVVHDPPLLSSRDPDDLPAFCRTIIETLA